MKYSVLLQTTFLFLALLGIQGCGKDEWKEPATLQLSVAINELPSADGSLQFLSGYVYLQEVEFEGTRTQGEDVYFSAPLQGLKSAFSDTGLAQLQFDIPQGTYTYTHFAIRTSDQHNLLVKGIYQPKGSDKIPIHLEIEVPTVFDLVMKDSEGNSESLTFSKNMAYEAVLTLDPLYWFSPISDSLLLNAERTLLDNVSTLYISKSSNTHLFDKLVERIDDAAELVLQP